MLTHQSKCASTIYACVQAAEAGCGGAARASLPDDHPRQGAQTCLLVRSLVCVLSAGVDSPIVWGLLRFCVDHASYRQLLYHILQVFCTKALPACGACPLAPQCEYAQQGGRRMAEGDVAPPAASAAAHSPGLTAQAAPAVSPAVAAPAKQTSADTGKSGPAEPAAPDTPPRLETARLHGRTSPQAQQQGLGPFAAPPLPDIEDSLAGSCGPTAAVTEPAGPAPAVQAASSAVSPQPASQHEQQCEPPASRPAAMTLAARDAAVQRILSAGDSPLTEGPAAAPAAERLDWCAMHTFRSSQTGCYLSWSA